jgi:hypothetical protein
MSEKDDSALTFAKASIAPSMVERVAEAIFLKEGRAKDVAWKHADDVLLLVDWSVKPSERQRVTDYYREIARTAIRALIVPNLAMRKACTFEEVEIAWPHLIDAALSEDGAAENQVKVREL